MYYFADFGTMLRKYREDKKYSREKLAELCDISDRCISNIERGVSDPKLSTALRLCEQCDIYTGSLSVLNADEDVHTDDSLLPSR